MASAAGRPWVEAPSYGPGPVNLNQVSCYRDGRFSHLTRHRCGHPKQGWTASNGWSSAPPRYAICSGTQRRPSAAYPPAAHHLAARSQHSGQIARVALDNPKPRLERFAHPAWSSTKACRRVTRASEKHRESLMWDILDNRRWGLMPEFTFRRTLCLGIRAAGQCSAAALTRAKCLEQKAVWCFKLGF